MVSTLPTWKIVTELVLASCAKYTNGMKQPMVVAQFTAQENKETHTHHLSPAVWHERRRKITTNASMDIMAHNGHRSHHTPESQSVSHYRVYR